MSKRNRIADSARGLTPEKDRKTVRLPLRVKPELDAEFRGFAERDGVSLVTLFEEMLRRERERRATEQP